MESRELITLDDGMADCLQPPPTFQPPGAASTTPSTAGSTSAQPKQDHIDLITRYNLASKISSPPSTPSGSEGAGKGSSQESVWSNNKNERQALFQRRREEMVLNARRKLEEKEKGKRVQGT